MNFICLLFIITLSRPLLLSGSQPIASASAASCSSSTVAAAIDSKNNNENPWIVKTGRGPTQIVFSPDNKFATVVNSAENTISVFKIDTKTGMLTSVQNSPFFVRKKPISITFSPDGDEALVTNEKRNSVGKYKINAQTGALTLDSEEYFKGVKEPHSISFFPSRQFVAVLSHRELNVFKIEKETGECTHVQRLSILPSRGPNALVFHPSGAWAVITNSYDRSISIFTVDTRTGIFTLAQGSKIPGQAEKPYPIAFSPNGKFAGFVNLKTIEIFKIDQETGVLTLIQEPSIPIGIGPSFLAFSPNGQLAGITNYIDRTLWMYEFDEQTGVMAPITGSDEPRAKREEMLKKTKEAFAQFGEQTHSTIQKQRAGFGENIPTPIELALKEYLVEPNAAQISKENPAEDALQKAVDETKQDRENNVEISRLLFAAIQNAKDDNPHDENEVFLNLTPFTINARDQDNNTPLIFAAMHNKINILKTLLEYKGKIQETAYKFETVPADLVLFNYQGDNALMVAASKGHFDVALTLAKAMKKKDPNSLCMRNKAKYSAYDLTLRYQATYSNSSVYQELLDLLTKHCLQDNAKRKALADKEEEDARPTKKIKNDAKDVKKITEKMKDE